MLGFGVVRRMGRSPDSRFDHDVDGAAGHDQVLHVVTPDKDEAAAAVEVELL